MLVVKYEREGKILEANIKTVNISYRLGVTNIEYVDYEGNGLYDLGTTTFEETFIEYVYSGQTISTENGIEDLTGNTKEKNKIIIDYRAK